MLDKNPPKTFALSAKNSISLSVKEFGLMQMFLANADIEFSTEHILEKKYVCKYIQCKE